MTTIELRTIADETGALHIGLSKQFKNKKFKVLLFAEEDEVEWTNAIQHNPVFDFLKDDGEDIYNLSDGKPING